MNDFNYTKNYIMKNILKRSQITIIEDMHNGGLFWIVYITGKISK